MALPPSRVTALGLLIVLETTLKLAMSALSVTRLSVVTVPSKKPCRISSEAEPRSRVPSVLGTMFVSTRPRKEIVSPVALPRSTLPFKVVLRSTFKSRSTSRSFSMLTSLLNTMSESFSVAVRIPLE